MDVVVTTVTVAVRRAKLQSNHHHQQTNIQLFTGRMPILSPNQQCQSTEGKLTCQQLENENKNEVEVLKALKEWRQDSEHVEDQR